MTIILGDRFSYSIILGLGVVVSSLVVSCGETKYAQCGQIIQIANGVVEAKTQLIDTRDSSNIETKTWLQAAKMISQAAQKVENVNLQDPKLIEYQSDLAQVYRIYAKATYDAVKAWENKNIQALQVANIDAAKAGQWEEKLGTLINSHCGEAKK